MHMLISFPLFRLRPHEKGFYRSVRGYFPEVWQQTTLSSVALSATHMMTIIHRRKNNNPNLRLSPSALLAMMTTKGIGQAELVCVLEKSHELGLEEDDNTETVYEDVPDFVYRNPPQHRYYVKRLVSVEGIYNIMCAIRRNFDVDGPHHPLMGFCYQMGTLNDNIVASKTTMDNPYCWGAYNTHEDIMVDKELGINEEEPAHAMLITGLFTMRDNPKPMDYSLEVKNSRGTNWGVDGYVWVTLDAFDILFVPVMDDDPYGHEFE